MSNCRSTSGFIFDVAGSSIAWSSKKQTTVVTSSVEAVWLHILLTELDFPPTQATVIYADKLGCIALANNLVSHSQAKYISIKHHFICKKIKCQEIKLDYVSTKNMLIDVFTKALPREAFEKFCAQLGVLPPD